MPAPGLIQNPNKIQIQTNSFINKGQILVQINILHLTQVELDEGFLCTIANLKNIFTYNLIWFLLNNQTKPKSDLTISYANQIPEKDPILPKSDLDLI